MRVMVASDVSNIPNMDVSQLFMRKVIKSQTTVSDWLVVLVMVASSHSVFGGQCCLPCCCVGQSSSTCCCVGQSSSTYCCVRQSCLMCYCFSAGQLFLTCHAGSRTFVPTSNVGVWCIL